MNLREIEERLLNPALQQARAHRGHAVIEHAEQTARVIRAGQPRPYIGLNWRDQFEIAPRRGVKRHVIRERVRPQMFKVCQRSLPCSLVLRTGEGWGGGRLIRLEILQHRVRRANCERQVLASKRVKRRDIEMRA